MAAGTIPAPGTKLGPCKGKCKHTDCAAARQQASWQCGFCDKPIGYETRFYDMTVNGLVHAACAENEADEIARKRAVAGE